MTGFSSFTFLEILCLGCAFYYGEVLSPLFVVCVGHGVIGFMIPCHHFQLIIMVFGIPNKLIIIFFSEHLNPAKNFKMALV